MTENKFSKCPFQRVETGITGEFTFPDCVGERCAGFIVCSQTCCRTGQRVMLNDTNQPQELFLHSEKDIQDLKELNNSAYNQWEKMEDLLRSNPTPQPDLKAWMRCNSDMRDYKTRHGGLVFKQPHEL